MPVFDGTGPGGIGPMTGRGMGPCGGGYGYGRGGYGRGMGYGRGLGRGFGWGYGPVGYTPRVTKKEEKEILEGDLEAIQEEMNDIKARLDEIKGE